MGAQLREFRRRIKSVQSTKKITRAMELIAASRIVKAQQRINASRPAAQVNNGGGRRSGGWAGGSSTTVLRAGDQTTTRLREAGIETVPFLVGRKALAYYRFRG